MQGYQKSYFLWLFIVGLLLAGCGQVNSKKGNQPAPSSAPSQAAKITTESTPTVFVPDICKKIAFVLSKNASSDIYTVCPDGSHLVQLTTDPAFDMYPAWSPDGSKIAFSSTRAGSSQIYIMGEDGHNPIKLTSDAQNDLPIWLPNGKQIAFRTTDAKGLWWWRIINITSNEITQLSEPSYDFFYQTPAWSPNGQQIAFMSLTEQKQRNDGSSQIHIKDINGSNDRALTQDIWANTNPVWSPDGTKIAFLSERDGTYNIFALYTITTDGKSIEKISKPIFPENVRFTWSPDGQQIAISTDAPGNISIIDIQTKDSKELLHLPDGQTASAPSWQP